VPANSGTFDAPVREVKRVRGTLLRLESFLRIGPIEGAVMSEVAGFALRTDSDDWWTVHRGASPILGTAIHNGHEVSTEAGYSAAIGTVEAWSLTGAAFFALGFLPRSLTGRGMAE
jgi:hypothetical protein